MGFRTVILHLKVLYATRLAKIKCLSGANIVLLVTTLDPIIEFEPEMEFMIRPGFIERSGFDCSVEERYYKMEKCGSLPSQTSGIWQCSSDSCDLQCQPGFESSITLQIACECDVSASKCFFESSANMTLQYFRYADADTSKCNRNGSTVIESITSTTISRNLMDFLACQLSSQQGLPRLHRVVKASGLQVYKEATGRATVNKPDAHLCVQETS